MALQRTLVLFLPLSGGEREREKFLGRAEKKKAWLLFQRLRISCPFSVAPCLQSLQVFAPTLDHPPRAWQAKRSRWLQRGFRRLELLRWWECSSSPQGPSPLQVGSSLLGKCDSEPSPRRMGGAWSLLPGSDNQHRGLFFSPHTYACVLAYRSNSPFALHERAYIDENLKASWNSECWKRRKKKGLTDFSWRVWQKHSSLVSSIPTPSASIRTKMPALRRTAETCLCRPIAR